MGDWHCPYWQPAIAVIIVQFVTDVYLVNKLFHTHTEHHITPMLYKPTTWRCNAMTIDMLEIMTSPHSMYIYTTTLLA